MRSFGDSAVDVPLAVAVILAFLAIMILAPFATVWSLNTLFGLGIAYGFYEWLAVVWLTVVTFGGIAYKKVKNIEK